MKQATLADCNLDDDGTLDTVCSVTCPDCGETEEYRYDSETAAEYRDDDTGELFDAFFTDIVLPDFESEHECGEDE